MSIKTKKIICTFFFICLGFFGALSSAQAATPIYRSVGPGATDPLAVGTTNNMTISGTTATFSQSLPDNVGVGDAIQYDSDGNDSIDAIAFIHGRTSATVYTVASVSGGTPVAVTDDQNWSIFRAYTSLFNATHGEYENTSLDDTVENFFTPWSSGKDITLSTGSDEQWNVACYAGQGNIADTGTGTMDGWTTSSENYIRIYTPNSTNEVGVSQRHVGRWDTAKYRLEQDAGFVVADAYVKIDGLQLALAGNGLTNGGEALTASNNIIKPYSGSTCAYGIRFSTGAGVMVGYAYNNIVYGCERGIARYYDGEGLILYAYNNTILDATTAGLADRESNTIVAKNNIVQNCTDGYAGTFAAGSDYNISDLANDAPSPSYRTNLATDIFFADEPNDDFHLLPSDTAVKNAGVDLSADANLSFNNDIDGETRIGTWDIGADEAPPASVYYSVGQNTTSHETGAGNVTISGTTATFTVAQTATNMGVGDVIDYDTDNKLCYISGKTSTTVWTCTNATGGTPTSATGVVVNSISHAFDSLSAAEAGAPTLLGNSDLTAIDVQLNFPCYYDTGADTTAVTVDGYTTDATRYIKIYTPNNTATEVNVSQRHNGKWDDGRYRIEYTTTGTYGAIVQISENYIKIDGLQLKLNYAHTNARGINISGLTLGSNHIDISNNIVRGSTAVNDVSAVAYRTNDANTELNAWNNIAYDFRDLNNANGVCFSMAAVTDSMDARLYNNVAFNCITGFSDGMYHGIVSKNNIAQNCTDGYVGTFDTSSDYNISDLAADAPGANSKNSTEVLFVDETNYDFHLTQTDTAARGAGTNLTNETQSIASLQYDIDGQLRNSVGAGWDIGADEGMVEFAPTVMQSGGDYSTLSSWEAGVQTDLVADTTRVFAHSGITGTIADNATITGLTSNATAIVVHASANQILLENISGTFASGEVVQVTAGNSVTISDNGNPASAVAKIDGAWSVADGTAVNINGSTTGVQNYIKIYTTEAARHQGKWDDGKYRLVVTSSATSGFAALAINDDDLIIDGLQIRNDKTAIGGSYGILFDQSNSYNLSISNNIIRGADSLPSDEYRAGLASLSGTNRSFKIWNNIIYSWGNISTRQVCAGVHDNTNNGFVYFYNNTLSDCYRGVGTGGSNNFFAQNNIINNSEQPFNSSNPVPNAKYNSTSYSSLYYHGGAFQASHEGDRVSQTFSFVDFSNDDFHLAENDTAARDAGTSLASSPPAGGLAFDTDIDGETRSGHTFDIGADEAAEKIYRSVGPGNVSALATDDSHVNNVTLTSGVATFSASLPDNIGVGDAVIIDTAGTANAIDASDTILFIQERISSTNYKLQTNTGAIPSDIPINDTYQIYRAHTSLANAEEGVKNTSILVTFNGGNRDLVTNNEQWNIACYGDAADTTDVGVYGWITGEKNYLKIYTPVAASEVGVTQRHGGKWDDAKYNIKANVSSSYAGIISVNQNHLRIEGIQIYIQNIGQYNSGGGVITSSGLNTAGELRVSNSIITGVAIGTNANLGIRIFSGVSFRSMFWNNIIYGFTPVGNRGILVFGDGNSYNYIYNNTLYNNYIGIERQGGVTFIKNNITQNCTDGYVGAFDALSDYNISDLAGDAPGANSKNSTNVQFMDEINNDFHLVSTDTAAKNAGINLSTDPNLFFNTDIDGKARPTGVSWDIGADETSDAESVRARGDIELKGNVKFR